MTVLSNSLDETEEFLKRFVVDLSQMLRDEESSMSGVGEEATAAWDAAQAQQPASAEELAEQQQTARVERERIERERRERARRVMASWRQGPAQLWFDALGLPDAHALARLLVEHVPRREPEPATTTPAPATRTSAALADEQRSEERALDRLMRQFTRLYRSQLAAVRLLCIQHYC